MDIGFRRTKVCLTDLGFEPEKNNFESVISPEVTQCGSVAGRYNPRNS